MRYEIERTNAVGLDAEAANKLDLLATAMGLSKQSIVSALVKAQFNLALRRGLTAGTIPEAALGLDAIAAGGGE